MTVFILSLFATGIIFSSCNKETCPAYTKLNNKGEKEIFLDSSYGSRKIPSPLTEEQKVLQLKRFMKAESERVISDRYFEGLVKVFHLPDLSRTNILDK